MALRGGMLGRFNAPKGQESLAQGLPWVFGLSPEALKGRPLTRRAVTTS
jgi:hypothetical protein